MENVVFVIPARSGSKGVKDKNIKEIQGKSLIQRSIECIMMYDRNSTIILNSDSEKYLNSIDGSAIRFRRDDQLGSDTTQMVDVLNDMEDKCYEYQLAQIVIIIQPTCPFRKPIDIEKGLKKFNEGLFDTVISVTKMEDFHPARMYKPQGKYLKPLEPIKESDNRQSLDEVYHRNGLIYITKKSVLGNQKIIGDNVGFITTERERSLNIDDELDWKLAEYFMQSTTLY